MDGTPMHWDDLDPLVRQTVLFWIKKHITPRTRINKLAPAFLIKTRMLHDIGTYLTNDAFKAAMIEAGYIPIPPESDNPYYRINLK